MTQVSSSSVMTQDLKIIMRGLTHDGRYAATDRSLVLMIVDSDGDGFRIVPSLRGIC